MRATLPGLALLALAGTALAASSLSSADTPITNTTVDTILVLEAASSPYTLDHDLHVAPGGFLLVGEGVELRMDNGTYIVGDGGSISATGTQAAPALIGPLPWVDNYWRGIELRNGSTLTLRHVRIVRAEFAVNFSGIATLDAQFVEFVRCRYWCIQTAANGNLDVRDSTMQYGGYGVRELGATTATIENVTVANFTTGLHFGSNSSGATVKGATIRALWGLTSEGASGSTFLGIDIRGTYAAVYFDSTLDVVISNATLLSPSGTAVNDSGSARLSLQNSRVEGGGRALSLDGSTALSLVRLNVSSAGGTCLHLLNLTNALLREVSLTGCARSLVIDPASGPPTADADRSNTVDGRPVVWVANAAGVVVDVRDDPGLVVLSSVAGATLTDLRLQGAGVHIFGSSQVVVERILVENADAAVVAVGTRGLTIRELAARNVTYGIRVTSSVFFPAADEVWIENVRIDGAVLEGIRVFDASPLTVLNAYVRSGEAALLVARVSSVLVQYGFFDASAYGVHVVDSAEATIVDNVMLNNTLGLAASNVTGYAARNAFVGNADHASTPGSPDFSLNETGGGNYWSGFTGPNANGDQFFDTPYNTTDLTGQDQRPRVGRLDFRPTVIVLPPGWLEVGAPATLDGGLSFDDFGVATIYWTVVIWGANLTGSGPEFPFTPPSIGNFTVIVEAQDTLGGVGQYTFTIIVRDATAPAVGPITISRPEIGGNVTVSLLNATDNDATFPGGITINWTLTYNTDPSTAITRTGSATNLSFEVPIVVLGAHTLNMTLRDRSGNFATATLRFNATDTTPPEVLFDIVGLPDLGRPFRIDASAAFDPLGVDSASALWQWADGGSAHNSTAWPAVNITFVDTGNHTVSLRLCDTAGNCGTTSVALDARDRTAPELGTLQVFAPGRPTVVIHAGDSPVVNVRLNDDVVFEIDGVDPSHPIAYSWNFGDGTQGEGSRLTHKFTGLGTVIVSVTITDSAGNSNTTAVRLFVEPRDPFEIIPGGAVGLLVIVAVVAAAVPGVFLLIRQRRKKPKTDDAQGPRDAPPESPHDDF